MSIGLFSVQAMLHQQRYEDKNSLPTGMMHLKRAYTATLG